MKSEISRRGFLISSTVGATGLLFARPSIAGTTVVNLLDPGSPLVIPENFTPSVWFTMQSSGFTNVHIFKQEIGQHVGTAFAQIVAEELELDWDKVAIDYPSMDIEVRGETGQQNTGGSMSVIQNFTPLAQAAAVARGFLRDAGADLMGSAPEDCIVKAGKVIDTLYEQEISYAEILSQTSLNLEIQPEELASVQLKPRGDYKIIGQSLPHLDIPEKVNGKARYGLDSYVPNMVYGKVSLAPTRLGSSILSIKDQSAREEIPGYIRTLSLNTEGMPGTGRTDVALVMAESFPAAMKAEKLVDVEWEVPESQLVSDADLYTEARRLINEEKGESFLEVGDSAAEFKNAVEVVEATYQTAMIEHAALEPRSALVQNIDGRYHVYAGVHSPSRLIDQISAELRIDPSQVVCHPMLMGGSFGDKIYTDQVVLAAQACQVLGRPVKVILTREDQFNIGHPKPISQHTLRAAIDRSQMTLPAKQIAAVTHDFASAPGSPGPVGASVYRSALDIEGESRAIQQGRGVVSGSDHWYDFENLSVNYHFHEMMARIVPVGFVRTVGNFFTVYAVESFIDELAHHLETDPLDLRLSLLRGKGRNRGVEARSKDSDELIHGQGQVTVGGGQRLANVLKIAAGQANYGSPLLPRNCAQGVSIAAAEGRWNPTFAACVADVESTSGGDIRVRKLTVAADVGLAVNPDGVRSQIEGSLMWGLSSTFYEETVLENGRLKETNFDAYKWQRNQDLPELDIHIVENGVHPSGSGENTLSLVAPAVCNAIQALTGKRLRSLPLKHHLPLV